MEDKKEIERLEGVAGSSLYLMPSNVKMIEYCFRIFQRHITGNSTLEMGPAEGVMTRFLYALPQKLTLLDGSSIFCEQLRAKFPDSTIVNELFENFKPGQKYDNIILGHVLEHVEDPVAILKIVKGWISDRGKILAAVPNSRSIHRQAAVIMGLLPFEESMNEMDKHHGHRRVFNPESFRNCFNGAGLKINLFGGYWLKPISNKQIHESWNDLMYEAFMQLGERYPDIAGEIYVVASK